MLLYMLFQSFCLSAFVYVCPSVLWFLFLFYARSLSLSLSLYFAPHRYPDLGREAFKMRVRDLAGKRSNVRFNIKKLP